MTGLLLFLLISFTGEIQNNYWNFPPLPPPEEYGNIIINRTAVDRAELPVSFSHWIHRRKYTCRVCHFELNIEMKVNTTEMTMEEMKQGEYCGACHNEIIAFGLTEDNCVRCHNGDIGYSNKKFARFSEKMPKALYGNRINWSKAIAKRRIRPRQSLFDENYERIKFKKRLRLAPEWSMVQVEAVFSHNKHTRWNDCAECHPDIFNIQKKGTKNFRMNYLLEGKFCGVCHLNVAFPMNDCRRCHPSLNQ